jgi:dinuclear metal center YbgI/SA1388 family protein
VPALGVGSLTRVPPPLTVGEIVALVERRYPPGLAADWDAVGLTCGDPAASVSTVLFAVDPVMAVVDEALLARADLLITHHPLFLRGVHSVAALTHRGRVAHTLISHGIALYSAHTNADHADPGVSDALAGVLGLTQTRPLVPETGDPAVGTGRVGILAAPTSLGAVAQLVADRLPATHHGVRVAGDLETPVRRVAVCGGSGDAFLAAAAASADVYVTSDLRHHRAQDHLAEGGCALVDVAHWAGEWPWLAQAGAELASDVREAGGTVVTHVSALATDPWTEHLGSTR